MNTNLNHGSATIYQFPARGRYAQGARAEDAVTRGNEASTARVAASSGWYHDAAIEAERVTRQ